MAIEINYDLIRSAASTPSGAELVRWVADEINCIHSELEDCPMKDVRYHQAEISTLRKLNLLLLNK